jgi:hypothetical protein
MLSADLEKPKKRRRQEDKKTRKQEDRKKKKTIYSSVYEGGLRNRGSFSLKIFNQDKFTIWRFLGETFKFFSIYFFIRGSVVLRPK